MADLRSTAIVLMMLGLVSQPVLQSTHFPTGWIVSTAGDTGQSSNRTQPAGDASIIGLVLNERHQPVARSTVQAFPALLALVLGPGASISGRVVVEAGTSVPSAVGLRVSATPTPEQYSASMPITATVADNWSFRMSGPSGSYQFTISADRRPFVVATRISVKGAEAPASAGVELEDGNQEVVLTIAPRESPKPIAEGTLSSAALVEQFKSEKFFFQQFTIAKEIVERHDTGVLPALASWLTHDDRHVRGIVAFMFAGLGDARGFRSSPTS